MSSAHTGKRCRKCGTQFRGTAKKDELCARCDVIGCEVPEDIDEQFEKLAVEMYGESYHSLLSASDLYNHKVRLSQLEKEIEQSNASSREKIRKKREIVKLREEIVVKEELMESIKSKMLNISLAQNFTKKKTVSTPSTKASTTPSAKAYSTPSIPMNSTPSSVFNSTPSTPMNSNPPATATVNSSPSYSPKRAPGSNKSTPVKWSSPIKTTPQPGTSRSPKSHAKVTFAIRPRKPDEVNNNVPVTASSSSDEESDGVKDEPVLLTRSNSVRDRVKAFEDLGRRHSTSSYDIKTKMASRNLLKTFNGVFS